MSGPAPGTGELSLLCPHCGAALPVLAPEPDEDSNITTPARSLELFLALLDIAKDHADHENFFMAVNTVQIAGGLCQETMLAVIEHECPDWFGGQAAGAGGSLT